MTAILSTRLSDRLEPGQDRAAFMQSICDRLAEELARHGAAGGVVDEVVWLGADAAGREGAVVVAVPAQGGFGGLCADACRDWLARRKAARASRAAEAGPLFSGGGR